MLRGQVFPTRSARWYLACSHVHRHLTATWRDAMPKDFSGAHVRRALTGLALLFVAACSRVPPHLELPHLETRQPAFGATLGGYSGTPVVAGNRVDILLNG